MYSKICVKWPLSKRQKKSFQDQLSLNAGQEYCSMLQNLCKKTNYRLMQVESIAEGAFWNTLDLH